MALLLSSNVGAARPIDAKSGVSGIDVTGACTGERWHIGTAVLEVSVPRIPCATFQTWMQEPRWVKRFTQCGRPGAYLRVRTPGSFRVKDPTRSPTAPITGSRSAWPAEP